MVESILLVKLREKKGKEESMKKKVLAAVLILCLTASLGLTGCGSSDKPYGNYDLSEYVKVGQYKGLEMEKISVSVSDEEVDTQVKQNVENTKTTEQIKSGKVAKNDVVNIDYEGKIKGKAFDGGTAKGQNLTIGSNTFIDGFEDGLIGKKVGSTQDLKLKFPKDYKDSTGKVNKELAGKDVVFTVTINYISKDKIPEYNDAWVAKNSGDKKVTTTAEYEKQVKKQLYEDKETSEKNTKMGQLWSDIVESSEVLKYPEEEVNTYVQEIESQYESMAKNSGMELEQLWSQYGIESEEDYNAQNKKSAESYVKEQMIMYDIADKEKLSYTDEDAEKLREQIDNAGYTEETFKQNFGQDIESYIVAALTFEQVGNFILDNAKIVDKVTDKNKDKDTDKETKSKDKDTKETTVPEGSTKKGEGADDATSNDEPGGADV